MFACPLIILGVMIISVLSRVYSRREGEYPTPLWYSVTAVRQGYDLYNHIHVSQFTLANRAILHRCALCVNCEIPHT